MDFDNKDKSGRSYALLYPTHGQNEELKTEAEKVGARAALWRSKGEEAFRLYEDKMPDGVNADATFGKFATAEAKEAALAETKEFKASRESAAKTMDGASKAASGQQQGQQADKNDLYRPAKGNGHREEFDKMRAEMKTTFIYSGREGAFVYKDGPREGFEKFQTPEAEAAWVSEYKESKKVADNRMETASKNVDVKAERDNGRAFLADNADGFMLPSKREEAARQAQIDAMKAASPEELSQVFKITMAAKERVDKQLYAIQIKAAQKENPDLSKAEFNEMKPDERRKAANGAGLEADQFNRHVGMTAGFFEARREMIERELLESKQSAQQQKETTKSQSAAPGGKGEEKKAPSAAKEEPAKENKTKGGLMAQQLAQAGMSH